MATSYKRIKAVSTAGAILKLLAQQKEPVPAGTIGEALKIPTPTVMCHLVTLEEMGFTQGINDHWKLGGGLALIYARVKSSLEAERDKIDSTLHQLENVGEN